MLLLLNSLFLLIVVENYCFETYLLPPNLGLINGGLDLYIGFSPSLIPGGPTVTQGDMIVQHKVTTHDAKKAVCVIWLSIKLHKLAFFLGCSMKSMTGEVKVKRFYLHLFSSWNSLFLFHLSMCLLHVYLNVVRKLSVF